MNESLKCECGNETFWMFPTSVCRCTKCFNNYWQRISFDTGHTSLLVSRFDSEEKKYKPYEHVKTF